MRQANRQVLCPECDGVLPPDRVVEVEHFQLWQLGHSSHVPGAKTLDTVVRRWGYAMGSRRNNSFRLQALMSKKLADDIWQAAAILTVM